MSRPSSTPGDDTRRLWVVDGQTAVIESRDDPPTTFEDCFRRYHRLVGTIGLRMLGRRDDVDDFVQDTFLEVHRSFDSIRDPHATKGFVRSIAVRVAIKKLKRRRVAALVGLDRPVDLGPIPVSGNQEHVAILNEVYRVLGTVPAKARVVWVLRHVEGEKLEDIATVAKMGLSTVKRHLAVASARLTEVLGE